MPGLPFGAARQQDVAPELRTYEQIVSIEFIEVDPDKVYPRSFAYRPVESGGQTRTRVYNPDLIDTDLSEDEARALIDGLAQAGVFEWHRVYRPAQGTFVVAAKEWRLEIVFRSQGFGKTPRPFKVDGENVYPDNYKQVVEGLFGLEEQKEEPSEEEAPSEEEQ